jgi:hypothetical protein
MSPAHVLLSPTDNSNLINISDFSKIGLSSVKESSAFKKIQYHSKSPASQLFDSSTINYSRFDVLSSLYDNSTSCNNSKDYYTDRQDSHSPLLVSQLNSSSSLDSNSVGKFLSYNYNLQPANAISGVAPNNYASYSPNSNYNDLNYASRLNSYTTSFLLNSDLNQKFIDLSRNSFNINNTSDGKYYDNPLKTALNIANTRRLGLNLPISNNFDLDVNFSLNEVVGKFSNVELSSKFKELKSNNMSFLSPDKNTRLINKLHTSKGQLNFSHGSSNLDDILNKVHSVVTDENEIYNSANLS